MQFAKILGGQLIKSRQLISQTMSLNQQIIRQYCNEEETYTDGNGTVHTLRRGDTVKVSPTSGKMYRPARDCAMCKLTHRCCQTVYYCNSCNVPLCRDRFRNNLSTKSEKHCFLNWHSRIFSYTNSRMCKDSHDLSEFEEHEPDIGAFDLL